jgi:hypothetical protein
MAIVKDIPDIHISKINAHLALMLAETNAST